MKKTHLVLLVVAAMTALLSAYSLAAINQVYKINFEWYSRYFNRYSFEERDVSRDRWQLQEYPGDMRLYIIGSSREAEALKNEKDYNELEIPDADYNKYIYLYCTLGKVTSPEYRIKVVDIAQRGSTVEVKISLNSPLKADERKKETGDTYLPDDLARIAKTAFSTKGKLNFIFKNQDGNQLSDNSYDIKTVYR